MGNKQRAMKYRNPWVFSEESEPEKVGSGTAWQKIWRRRKLRRRLSTRRWKEEEE